MNKITREDLAIFAWRFLNAVRFFLAMSTITPFPAIAWRPEWHRSRVRLVLDLDETLVGSLPLVAALKSIGIYRPHLRSSSADRLLKLLAAQGVVPDKVVGEEDNPELLFVRPGLDAFLAAALCRFAAVAIWSAASDEWVEHVMGTGPLAKHRDRFAFVWDGSRCVRSWDWSWHTKPLKKVWRSVRGWDKTNTVILDDSTENFVRNYGNGIRMPAFDVKAHVRILAGVSIGPSDHMLAAATRYSADAVLAWTDVRPPEKRGWHHACPQ